MTHLALLLAAGSLALPAAPRDGETWRALPLPSLSLEAGAGARLLPLEYGRHLVQIGEDLAERSPSAAPHLPIPMLLGLLSDEVARRDLTVEFQPTAPPLMARGSEADLDALEAVLADLERAGRALEIQVEAWLTSGATNAGTHPSATDLDAAVGDRAPWAAGRVRSGGGMVLGTRENLAFVLGYSVEIATDSAVADPVMGSAIVGTTLHLIATRTDGGRRIQLEGFLDLSEQRALDEFDTDTYDIGVVQQPRLGVLQIAFSGTVSSGGILSLSFTGAPLAVPDQTLWLRVRCEPDLPASGTWRGLDVALLERRIVDLPLPHPGAGLEAIELPARPRVLCESLPASALAQAFSRDVGRSRSMRAIWTPGYLLAPADGAGWAEVEALVQAAQRAREPGATLTLTHGPLRVQFPVSEGLPARVFAGIETTVVSDYDVEVATEVWMPQPVVEPVFDGLLLQGALQGGALRGAAWIAGSRGTTTLEREQVRLGRLQLNHRSFQATHCEVPAGASSLVLLGAAPGEPGEPGAQPLTASLDLQ